MYTNISNGYINESKYSSKIILIDNSKQFFFHKSVVEYIKVKIYKKLTLEIYYIIFEIYIAILNEKIADALINFLYIWNISVFRLKIFAPIFLTETKQKI